MSLVSPDSSVDITTRYGLDDPGVETRWGVRDLPHPSKPALVPAHSPVQWVPGFFLRVKVVGAWHLTFTPI